MNDRLQVLLVEDNPGDAYLIVELLSTDGPEAFEVDCAHRLSEALEYINTTRFDIVLLDLGLPDSDGLGTFRTLRQHAAHLPIVVMTGNTDERMGLVAVREGAQDYLIKGQIQKNLLIRSVRYAVARSKNALKELNDIVEKRIVDRTAQLTAANKALRIEIAEFEQEETTLRMSEEQLRTVNDNSKEPTWACRSATVKKHHGEIREIRIESLHCPTADS